MGFGTQFHRGIDMSCSIENDRKDKDCGPATDLAPADYCDPVIEAYKKDVDRTLLRENLKLTVQERFDKFERFMECVYELREAGRRSAQAGRGPSEGS
jgi:hypothetical protein